MHRTFCMDDNKNNHIFLTKFIVAFVTLRALYALRASEFYVVGGVSSSLFLRSSEFLLGPLSIGASFPLYEKRKMYLGVSFEFEDRWAYHRLPCRPNKDSREDGEQDQRLTLISRLYYY
jgi:hypothetical protein